MATKKTTKKTTKKVIKKVDELTNIVKEEKPVTDDEKILGITPVIEEKSEFNYESSKVSYKVTNLILNNGSIIVSGDIIESFIGSRNIKARKQLLEGAKKVITYNADNKEAYKIEVL